MTEDVLVCPVVRVTIEDHPNADRLEIARAEGMEYTFVVGKGTFKTGDEAVFLPEDSIVPEDVLKSVGLNGKLAGSKGNRVKASVLREVESHGVLVPNTYGKPVGTDMRYFLGVKKYYPPISLNFSGKVKRGPTLTYKINNWQQYPTAFDEVPSVIYTEKIHGSWCCLGYSKAITDNGTEYGPVITTKGHSQNGLCFELDVENQSMRQWNLGYGEVVKEMAHYIGESVYVLGEVYGRGIQGIHYDTPYPKFRVFDIYIGDPKDADKRGSYASYMEMQYLCNTFSFDTVPVTEIGRFTEDKVLELAELQSQLYNGEREGIVMRPYRKEEYSLPYGKRLILKHVGKNYIAMDDDKYA